MRKPIWNVSRSYGIALNQAITRLEAGTAIWVEPGRSIRELSLAEVMERRQLAQERVGMQDTPMLASAELPGLVYQPPDRDKYACLQRRPLVFEAAKFLREQASL